MIVHICACHFYLASVRGHNKKGLDGMFTEEGMSLMPIAWLHLVISIQTFQSGPCDMNLTVGEGLGNRNNLQQIYGFIIKQDIQIWLIFV